MDKKRVMIVDDNLTTLKVIKAILEEEKYEVYTASTQFDAINIIHERKIHVILLDLKMPDTTGLELFKKMRIIDADVVVFIMTAYGTVESAVEAMKLGIENYLQKPLNYDELKITMSKIFERIEMQEDFALLKGERQGENVFQNMIGQSKKMKEVFKKIINVARTNSTVLITGESGTGKEMVARAIHNLSSRKQAKMVGINLAAIPEGLQESELFGYEKGAFTGAVGSRPGKFEAANGGTVFLDEIGNTNYKVQAKLLRVLEERKIEPLGSNKTKEIDVRILSATNSDLREMVRSGQFREDLYFRLNVITLDLPPLRDRKADIPLLTYNFLKEVCIKNNFEEKNFSDQSMEELMNYDWPGNIRELRNVIEEAAVISNGRIIAPEALNLTYGAKKTTQESQEKNNEIPLPEVEKNLIANALIKTKGNQTKAAQLLGISRKILMNKMKKYDVRDIVPVRTKKQKMS